MPRWLVKLGRRLRLLAPGNPTEREMAEEIRFHLEQAAGELERAGRSPAEARREALRSFGAVEQIKEDARDSRGGRVLIDLVADLRYAGRQIRRAPASALAATGILAAALIGAIVALSVARGFLYRPLPVPEPDRLVSVIAAPSREPFARMPRLAAVDWVPGAALFEETAAWDLDGFTLADPIRPEYVDGSWVSPGFFTLLDWRPSLGRGFEADDYRPGARVALISDALWRRRFGGTPAVIGQAIRLFSTDRPDDPDLVTIVGVLSPSPWQVHPFTDVLRPLATPRMFSLARLRPGTTRDEAAARLTTVVRAQLPGADPAWRMSLVSTLDEHVYPVRPSIRVLVAAAVLLVLLAHASAGALLVMRGTVRLPELAVRRALGASRARVVGQLLIEGGLLHGAAVLIALAVGPLILPAAADLVVRFGGVTVPGGLESLRLDGVVVAVVAAGLIVPFLAAIAVPLALLAWHAPGGTLATAGRSSAVPGVVRSRRWLVGSQVAIAVALLIQAALLGKSLGAMARADLGFEPGSLLKAHLLLPRADYPDGAGRTAVMDRILERLGTVPGVAMAAAVFPHPFRGTGFDPVECDGCDPAAPAPPATAHVVSERYFATLGIALVAGRGFDGRDDAGREPVAIVSADLARRLFGAADPIGRRVRERDEESPGEWLTVIGVVGDVRKTYGDTLYPDLYRPFRQAPRAYTALMIRSTGSPRAVEIPVRAAVAAERPTLALSDVESMAELLAGRRDRTALLAGFVGAVGLLAFVLTVAGLYAVMGQMVRARRRELAVRSALGARPATIARTAVAGGRWMVVAGLVAGGGLGALGSLVARSTLVGVSPADPTVYLAVVAVVAAVAAMALAVPALRASRVDPAATLREE